MRAILLFLLLLLAVYLVRRAISGAAGRAKDDQAGRPAQSERMIACVHCGLHVPQSESVGEGEARFCCPEHQRLHRSPDR